ncbi:MAG: hypothetical protein NTW21_26655 [Verrucomicrobia bacterium]|nr:hypothetical protein [Verrucomicrobiota bacterium]
MTATKNMAFAACTLFQALNGLAAAAHVPTRPDGGNEEGRSGWGDS